MSTPPKDISFYGITGTTAYIQWFCTGADTNYTDIVCYDVNDPNTPVFWYRDRYTPNTQHYSEQITGLKPGHTYECNLYAKYDKLGTGTSVQAKSQKFTTLDEDGNETSRNVQQLVYVKTNVGGYFFDACLQSTHTESVTVTDHPVETGASISDHSYVNPSVLEMQIGMSDVASSIVGGQFSLSGSRSVAAFAVLEELMRQRIPVQVVTKLKVYQNMLITDISVPDDYTTAYSLKATVTFREIIVAVVKTLKISARPQTTGSTNRGTVEPEKPNKSIAKQIEEELGPLLGGIFQ